MALPPVIQFVNDFREELDLDQRYKLANRILSAIESPLRLFIFGRVERSFGDDVLHITLNAIFTSLQKFQGHANEQFWAWAYKIARNKINDHHRGQFRDRLDPLPIEEIWELLESAHSPVNELTLEDRDDLEFALNLLSKSKPECRELLWKRFVLDLDYEVLGEEIDLNYDAVRARIKRCLDSARGNL
jgi:RNA polymerase sigma factor (sigma-70 family)